MYLIFSVKGDNYIDIFVCLREIIFYFPIVFSAPFHNVQSSMDSSYNMLMVIFSVKGDKKKILSKGDNPFYIPIVFFQHLFTKYSPVWILVTTCSW
jgi:hypothetical protein